MIQDFFKDGSFVLISCYPGSNNLGEQIYSLIGCYGGQALEFSQWCQTFFTAANRLRIPQVSGKKYLEHLISIISSL
jgi:hypothetical protein